MVQVKTMQFTPPGVATMPAAFFLTNSITDSMIIHIEIFAFHQEQAHGAIWLDNGVAIPISMPIQSYETAKANNLFQRDGDQDDLFPDPNGVLNETTFFLSPREIQPAILEELPI